MQAPILRVLIPHRGIDGKHVSDRRRDSFARAIQISANAAAALARWPHYTGEWGPTCVTRVGLLIEVFNTSTIGSATLDGLQTELGRWVYSPLAERRVTVAHPKDNGGIRIEVTLSAMVVETVENPADKSAREAREEPAKRLQQLEPEVTVDEDGHIIATSVGAMEMAHLSSFEIAPWADTTALPQPPPVDRIDEYIENLERGEPDPNAITPSILQRDVKIEIFGNRNGKGIPKAERPVTGTELINTHQQRTADSDPNA